MKTFQKVSLAFSVAALVLAVYVILAPPPTKYGTGTTVFTNLQAGQIDASTGMSVANTPVIAFSTPIPTPTPQTLFLQYAAGKKAVCGSQNITGTGTLAHGLATPQYVFHSFAGPVTYANAEYLDHLNVGAVVTVNVSSINILSTPVPGTTPIAVDWCVIGTP